eukprot:1230696-Karenia_brevis.AAC.1
MEVTTCGAPSSSVLSKFRSTQCNGFNWKGQEVLNEDIGQHFAAEGDAKSAKSGFEKTKRSDALARDY